MMSAATATFLDIAVHRMTVEELTALVEEGISTDQKWLIANHNLHSLYLFHKESQLHSDPKLKSYFRRAKCTHMDGMSMVALARLYGHDVRRDHRVGYTDWLPYLMDAAVRGKWRIFYLGSGPVVVDEGAEKLRQLYTGLNIRTRHGYFDINDEAENDKVLAEIAEFKPDLLMVGMGMPRQERWIEDNFERIQSKVVLASGAALDYVAGAIPTPPRWLGRLGLEWAFRLASEPRRLAYRYLVEPWYILFWLFIDLSGIRKSQAYQSPSDMK